MSTATENHAFDNGSRAFDVICAQCGLSRVASVHDAPSSEHTPTPWTWIRFEGEKQTRISPSVGMFNLATLESDSHEADAAFIVKAVNSHDALVTHLLTSNEMLGRCAAQFEMLCRPDLADDCMAKAKANRAALALVEGGQ